MSDDDAKNIVPMEEGVSGKAHILFQRLVDVIWSEEFNDMTISEVLGALFLVMLNIAKK
jgi:hypothetical protein